MLDEMSDMNDPLRWTVVNKNVQKNQKILFLEFGAPFGRTV